MKTGPPRPNHYLQVTNAPQDRTKETRDINATTILAFFMEYSLLHGTLPFAIGQAIFASLMRRTLWRGQTCFQLGLEAIKANLRFSASKVALTMARASSPVHSAAPIKTGPVGSARHSTIATATFTLASCVN